ncbi:MAG: rRNA processing protein RimM [Actinomycetota bacterium]
MSTSSTTDLLEVGRVGKPHGVRGDTYVTFTSDVAARHEPGSVMFVRTASGERRLVVERSRPEKERHVVHFEGVETREDAARLTNAVLLAEPLDDGNGELWVHRLIGSSVVECSGTVRGTCVAVVANPAHDLLELDDGSLVPVPFVVSCEAGVTVIDPPEGLFGLDDRADGIG